ncbi:MAG: DUF2189 domain-containing protein [Burkholderiales bacterium]|nr:DUF2189 domain-containing protein [Burkholderiales bacterium]MCH2242252.1 DUF2189 domain-containing protein [Aquabacterium sp.]
MSAASTDTRPLAVRTVPPTQPLRWLGRAWQDFGIAPEVDLVHGVLLAAFGAALLLLAGDRFWWLAGAFSGFLIVAPILATGLYAVSRAGERGEPAGLFTVWSVWASLDRRLVAFGLLLALAGTGWVIVSAALITLLAPHPIHTPTDFVRYIVVGDRSGLFPLWLGLGGLLAAPVFASSVVSIPLLLDRRVTVWQAVLTSWRAVMANPLPLGIWAAVVMTLTLLGLGTFLFGLVLVMPVLGHATWYAYRDLVEPEAA